MKLAAVVIALTALLGAVGVALLLRPPRPAEQGPSHPGPGLYRGSEPPGRILLPRFVLPTSNGTAAVRSDALRGRVVLTTFVDSACKESCPLIVGILGNALRRLRADERARVVALAISVEPTIDTPAHVRRFLRERRATELTYLVAPAARMTPIWRRFGVLSATQTGKADFHSADVRIFDRNGAWVSTMNLGPDLNVANVVHDLRQAMKAGT